MKDCCKPDENPGILKRLLNGFTILVLIALALFGVASIFIL
ncbi:hypothetical protein GGR27_001349 [Lewinella antarctica]|uniref:Uncharacterized protein n=1 Tax=Neolewinella antarctica TaxID=442734 RepID=A0ABX0X9Y2_9BACT|nr:hypothetical protein [Neolewinella antarctica]